MRSKFQLDFTGLSVGKWIQTRSLREKTINAFGTEIVDGVEVLKDKLYVYKRNEGILYDDTPEKERFFKAIKLKKETLEKQNYRGLKNVYLRFAQFDVSKITKAQIVDMLNENIVVGREYKITRRIVASKPYYIQDTAQEFVDKLLNTNLYKYQITVSDNLSSDEFALILELGDDTDVTKKTRIISSQLIKDGIKVTTPISKVDVKYEKIITIDHHFDENSHLVNTLHDKLYLFTDSGFGIKAYSKENILFKQEFEALAKKYIEAETDVWVETSNQIGVGENFTPIYEKRVSVEKLRKLKPDRFIKFMSYLTSGYEKKKESLLSQIFKGILIVASFFVSILLTAFTGGTGLLALSTFYGYFAMTLAISAYAYSGLTGNVHGAAVIYNSAMLMGIASQHMAVLAGFQSMASGNILSGLKNAWINISSIQNNMQQNQMAEEPDSNKENIDDSMYWFYYGQTETNSIQYQIINRMKTVEHLKKVKV